jgi:hypothetical protein
LRRELGDAHQWRRIACLDLEQGGVHKYSGSFAFYSPYTLAA